MIIRTATAADHQALAQIFFDAVRIGAAPKYTPAELQAWAPEPPSGAEWSDRLAGLAVWLAESGARPLGFFALGVDGYLDLAFVAPDQRGKGVADALHADMLRQPLPALLTTRASRMAHPFFLRMGWQETGRILTHRHGETLEGFAMQFAPPLSGPASG